MMCPRCKIEMGKGKSLSRISADGSRGIPLDGGPWAAVKLIECHKCAQCGHSEKINK